MANKLIEVPRNEWQQLRDLYKVDWPNNFLGYYTINNYMEWFKKDPTVDGVHIYSLNGDYSDGTFLVVDVRTLLFNSLNKSTDRLATALGLLDWKNGLRVNSYLEKFRDVLLNQISSEGLKLEYDDNNLVHYLPAQDVLAFDVNPPEDVILKTVSQSDVNTIDEVWPHKHNGSDLFLKRAICYAPTIGVYTKKDGELVAWCLTLQSGALGVLQVKESFKKRGYGTLVTKTLSKELAQKGIDSFAFVFAPNTPSRGMFEKLGYKVTGKVYWCNALAKE